MTKTELLKRRRKAVKIIRELKKLFPNPKIALKHRTNWQLFVSVVLSAQCTDKKVNEVTKVLFKKYRTLDDYVRASHKEFERDIHSTGFYRNKSKNILSASRVVKEKFGGKIPKTMKEILTIPGVGRKSANVILGNAYGIVEGIAVDTHVWRLSRQLGLTDKNTPEKIERDLMDIIPKREWFNFTYQLIGYGRTYCPAGPHHKHDSCPLMRYYVQ